MASITSLSNSNYNTSSIYGSRNVLSGLASGMDTESMIENAVSGIKLKIQNLTKKRTKIEWQQEAYRSIIDKAVDFNRKYTSYSSKTNLLSGSFFNNAVNTVAKGTYADKITASGKTSSDIKINAVKQMAQAATYTVSGLGGSSGGEISGITGKEFDIAGTTAVSTVSGTLTFQYGGQNGASFDIKFDELENLDKMEGMEGKSNAEKLAKAIENKLSDITYNYTKNGFQESTTADKAIKVSVENGEIKFSDGLGNGNKVSISFVSGAIEDTLGIKKGDTSITMTYDTKPLVQDINTADYLTGGADGKSPKELSITFNGTTKKISMSEVLERAGAKDDNGGFVKALNEELAEAFGEDKITASYTEDGKLSLTPNGKGDTMALGGSAAEGLGFTSGDANYINTGKKLKDLAGSVFTEDNRIKGTFDTEGKKPTEKTRADGTKYYLDDKGNRVDEKGYRIDSDGKALYDFEINGAHINVTEDTTLESLMNSINSNADAGVKVSYSKLTNEFKFTATETGANSKIEFGGLGKSLFASNGLAQVDTSAKISGALGDDYKYSTKQENFKVNVDGKDIGIHVNKNSTIDDIVGALKEKLTDGTEVSFDAGTNSLVFKKDGDVLKSTYGEGIAADLFKKLQTPEGTSYTAGQDAVMDVTINGKQFNNLTRSSNSFDIDGLTINVKGTFEAVGKDGEAYEPITFNTTTDSDKIVDAIKSFVEDYNAMATEIKNAYSTMPQTNTSGNRYEPLTAEEEDKYSESELKAYNERAKQGILFGDSTLSSMYSKLLSAIQPSGADGVTLRQIGIDTSYSGGMTTLSLDEDKLRAALDSNPDKVKDAFTKTKEGGSSSNGLMQNLQNTLNAYVKETGEPKGILITHAGSIKSPTSLNSNTLKSQMDSIDSQIDRWTDKMSNQIDRYTSQFSKLEQLIAQMNSQSSTFAGLMGGSSGY